MPAKSHLALLPALTLWAPLLGTTPCWWHVDGILADFVRAVLWGFLSCFYGELCLELVEQQDFVPEQYDGLELELGVSGGVLRAGGTHNWGSPAHRSSVESSLMLAALIRAIRAFFQGGCQPFQGDVCENEGFWRKNNCG